MKVYESEFSGIGLVDLRREGWGRPKEGQAKAKLVDCIRVQCDADFLYLVR